jgi:PAS domain S-box-containing protein
MTSSYRPDTTPSNTAHDITHALEDTLKSFQQRAEKLSQAYESLQKAFAEVNVELEKKNEQLRESLTREKDIQIYLQSILESMQNGVIGIDTRGTITHFNRAAAEITGYSPAEVIGTGYDRYFFREEDSELTLVRALSRKTELKKEEKCIRAQNGKLVPVSFQASLLRDKNGQILGAVEIFSDISRIKALETQLQHNKTLAAIGKMAAQVAHEIRNPLGAMGNYVGILELDTTQDDPRKPMINKLSQSISRLDTIVQNLLHYSKPTTIDFRRVELNEFVQDIAGHVTAEIERKEHDITVETHIAGERSLYAQIDPTKMEEAFLNLCFNAVDAMAGEGVLSLRVCADSQKYDAYCAVSIVDTGQGIAAHELERIFTPFHTTKEKGTGLGLSIVKKIIEQHSGYIHVVSEQGRGSTFTVYLPRTEQ